jgi:hypothetical protein
MKTSWLTHLDARVPRYTSYPTAPHFHAGVNGKMVDGWLGGLDLQSRFRFISMCRFARSFAGIADAMRKS